MLGPDGLKVLLYTILATGGGLLGYLMRTLEDEDEDIHWGKGVVQAFGAGFTGLLMSLFCQAVGLNDLWTGVIVGFFGWMGASVTIVVLEKLIYAKLGIKNSDKDKK